HVGDGLPKTRQEELKVRGAPQRTGGREHQRRDDTQARNDFPRFRTPSHMGIAGGEIAVGVGVAGIILYRKKQVWSRLVETLRGEMGGADDVERAADAGARAKAQRDLDMLDREIVLAGPSA